MKKLKLEELEVKSLVTSVDLQEETKGGTALPTTLPCGAAVVGTAVSVLMISAVIYIGTQGSY